MAKSAASTLRTAGWLLLSVASAHAAEPYASDWAKGLKSSARLIAASRTLAGVEIQLAPGAITYWRNPGDAGLPPTFSFEGSSNLAHAEVRFPPPIRIREGDGEAFGYDRSVILPIEAQASDPAKPVELALKLDYAVCEKICVPAQARLNLTLASDQGSPFAQSLLLAQSATPRHADWRDLRGSLAVAGANRWRLCVPRQAGATRDAFVEPPELWWIAVSSQPGADSCFSLEVKQKPEGASLPVTALLTITGGDGPIETSITLAP